MTGAVDKRRRERVPTQSPDIVQELVGALWHEVRNCPMCKGDGKTDQTFEHMMLKLARGELVECPRCKSSRGVLSRAEAALDEGSGGGWRPIEGEPDPTKAPWDGSMVLLGWPALLSKENGDQEPMVRTGRWLQRRRLWSPQAQTIPLGALKAPTHWQPLPPPPPLPEGGR